MTDAASLNAQLRALKERCPNARDYRSWAEYDAAYATWLAEKGEVERRMDGEHYRA